MNITKIEELVKKYKPLQVDEESEYHIEKIVKYTKKLPSENPHAVNPEYLKLPASPLVVYNLIITSELASG